MVLRARGTELEQDFSFGCVRQWFEPLDRRGADHELFQGAAALARPVVLGDALPPEAPDAAYSVLHGLYWLLADLTDRTPVALILDDAHWADPASLRFVDHLGPRLEGLRLCLLVATRPIAIGGTQESLTRLVSSPSTTHLRPRPLSTTGTRQLVDLLLSDDPGDELSDACHRATSGNPLYLTFLVRQMLAAGGRTSVSAHQVAEMRPDTVAASVMLAVASLHPAATALVRALAVVGDGTPTEILATLADHPAEATAAAREAVEAAGLLAGGDVPRFAHPVVREAVYGQLPLHERRALHQRAASILRDAQATSDRVAAQLLVAGPGVEPWAADVLVDAAWTALSRGDPSTATRYLLHGLTLPGGTAHSGLLLALGLAELLAGQLSSAVIHLATALENAETWAERSTLVEYLATAHYQLGQLDESEAVLLRHLEDAPDDADPDTRMRLEAQLMGTQLYSDPSAVETTVLRARSGEAASAAGRRLMVASTFVLVTQRQPVNDLIGRVLDAADSILAEEGPVTAATSNLLYMLVNTDQQAASAVIETVLSRARASGSRFGAALALHSRSRHAHRRGDLAAAAADGRAAWEGVAGIPLGQGPALAALVSILIDLGETSEARSLVDAYEGQAPDQRSWMESLVGTGAARLLLAEGRHRESLVLLDALALVSPGVGGDLVEFEPWRHIAVPAHLASGDIATAQRLADDELTCAQRSGLAGDIGVALRLVASTTNGPEAEELLQTSIRTLEPGTRRLELARSLTDLGVHLRGQGRRTDAAEALGAAFELAESCHAGPLQQRTRVELAAIGVRPRQRPTSIADSLTPAERQVCDLAASGLSNPEIAQALFVTRKTVETHLGHAYRKLGISGRADLPDALRR